MREQRRFGKIVFVIKKENDEIYFLGRKCNSGHGYTTPGGGFDLDDKTPIETAKRELREELNINLTNIPPSFEPRLINYNNSHRPALKSLLANLLDLNSSLKWETNVKPVLETNLLLEVLW